MRKIIVYNIGSILCANTNAYATKPLSPPEAKDLDQTAQDSSLETALAQNDKFPFQARAAQ